METQPDGVVLGIDLGTSNSALSHLKLGGDDRPEQLQVPQLVGNGVWESKATLPSALYIPHDGECPSADSAPPWGSDDANRGLVIGSWARQRGAETVGRVITSAKSWLCHRSIDRRQSILPWMSELEQKYSPVTVSAFYLQYLFASYRHQFRDEAIAASVVTVPASFDEVARNLTVEAAAQVGLPQVSLLEEPQAAFYAWIEENASTWRQQIEPGDVVLVCDVGGGTTDFSLIAVDEDDGELRLERLSVGDHLLLGGDNMDLALAHQLAMRAEDDGQPLDQWQFQQLTHGVRVAKERFLVDDGVDELSVAVAAKGASLLASTRSFKLDRSLVQDTVLDGFFPDNIHLSEPGDMSGSGVGLMELGLQYEANPAITAHLAKFLIEARTIVAQDPRLTRLAERALNGNARALVPSAVLFNGGVFHSPLLRQRVLNVLSSWADSKQSVKELLGSNADLAVARGAATFARMKTTGEGLRIRSGTTRSYYLGLEEPRPAVPGRQPELQGVCLVPHGTEEGSTMPLRQRPFGLVTGRPVSFRFFSSRFRPTDALGQIVRNATTNLEESSSLDVELAGEEGEVVPVFLEAQVSDVGTLHLYMCHHTDRSRRWELTFNLRAKNE